MISMKMVYLIVQLTQPGVPCQLLSSFLMVVLLEIIRSLHVSLKVSLNRGLHFHDTRTYGMFPLFWIT